MRKHILMKIFIILFTLIVAGVMAFSVRGVQGNPQPDQIITELKDAGDPFELSPESGRYALVMSLEENRTLSFSPEIASFVIPDLGYIDGRYVSLFAPGVSVFAIPMYRLGSTLDLAQVSTFATPSIFAVLNFLLIILLVRKFSHNTYAGMVAGATYLFATTSYAYSVTLYQHQVTAFFLLAGLYTLTFIPSAAVALVFGFIVGIAFFVEYPAIIFMLPLVVLFISKFIKFRPYGNSTKVTLKLSIFIAIIGLVYALIPSLLYNHKAHGNPFQMTGTVARVQDVHIDKLTNQIVPPPSEGEAKSAAGFFKLYNLPESLEVLLTSKDRGVMLFAPIMFLFMFGVRPLYKKLPITTTSMLFVIGTVFLLYGMWGDPWGGWAFGPRYLIPAFAFMAVFLGVAIDRHGAKIAFILSYFTIFFYSLCVNTIGALTTNKIPPSVEIDALKLPEFTFLHNLQLYRSGLSGSYLYNYFLSESIPLPMFGFVIIATVVCMTTIAYIFAIRKK